jgi:hypothetical protein
LSRDQALESVAARMFSNTRRAVEVGQLPTVRNHAAKRGELLVCRL